VEKGYGNNQQRMAPIDGVEGSPAGAPYQIYKHANGKIELRGIGANGS